MKDKKYVPEQVAEQLLQYAKNGWQSLFQNGAAMQDAVLADVIELARNSTYAKDHGFDGIKTKEEFLQKVPLSEYGDYVAYIQDNMRQDSQQLTALEIRILSAFHRPFWAGQILYRNQTGGVGPSVEHRYLEYVFSRAGAGDAGSKCKNAGGNKLFSHRGSPQWETGAQNVWTSG